MKKIFILASIILTAPILVTNWTLYPYVHGKTLAVILAAHLVLVIFVLARYRGAVGSLRLTPLIWAMAILSGVFLISGLAGVNFEKSLWGSFPRLLGLYHFIIIFLLAIVLGTVFTKEDWRRLFRFGLVISAIVSLLAILQKFFPWFVWYGSRVGSTLDNPSFLAGYLIFFIFWGLILETNELDTVKRRLILAATAINVVALVLTKTRGALLGLVIGLFVTIIFLLIKKEGRKIGLMFMGLLGVLMPAVVFFDRHRILINQLADSTTMSRLLIWKSAWLGFLNRSIFGWGFENFNAPFNIFYNPKLLAFSYSETFADKAHNNFIELLATTGLVGLLAYLGLFAVAIYSIVILHRRGELNSVERAFFFGLLISYAIGLSFLFDQLFTLVLFFFTLAYLHTLYRAKNPPRQVRPSILCFGLVALTVSAYYGVIKPATASIYTHRAVASFRNDQGLLGLDYFSKALAWSGPWYPDILSEEAGAIHKQLLDETNSERVPRDKIEAVFLNLEKARNKYPYDIRFPIFIGYLGHQLGIRDNAYLVRSNTVLGEALSALSENRQQLSYLLVENFMLQNKTDEAIAEARRILSQAPEVADSHYHLGNALLLAGEEAEGLEKIKEAERLGYPEVGAKPLLILITKAIDQNDWPRVIALYSRATIIEPTNGALFAQLAAVYKKVGDIKKARQAVEKAVQLNPDLKSEAERFIKTLY